MVNTATTTRRLFGTFFRRFCARRGSEELTARKEKTMTQYGPKREDIILQPVSGKALEVYRGEVLRIIQIEGEQCVDFNAFNLHYYKEYLGVSNTRSRNAFRVKKGDLIWTVD